MKKYASVSSEREEKANDPAVGRSFFYRVSFITCSDFAWRPVLLPFYGSPSQKASAFATRSRKKIFEGFTLISFFFIYLIS